MIEKVTYNEGKIRSGFDTFNCTDKADMEIFCDRINELIMDLKIDNASKTNQINLIKQVLELKE